jgi:TPR repeat protein
MNYLRYLLISIALICSGCATTSGGDEEQNEELEIAREQFHKKQYESSAITLLPLARAGNAEAQYSLGYLYYYGLGIPRNEDYGWQLIQASAEQGNDRAVAALTLLSRQEGTLGPTTAASPHSGNQAVRDID